MALTATVTGLVLVAQDFNLLAAVMLDDFGLHCDAGKRLAIGDVGAAIDNKNRTEGDSLTGLGRHTVNADEVANFDLLLVTRNLDNRVHSHSYKQWAYWVQTRGPQAL